MLMFEDIFVGIFELKTYRISKDSKNIKNRSRDD